MHALIAKLPPSVAALILQFIAFLLTLVSLHLLSLQLEPIYFALFCGGLAAVLSYLAGLARWWLPMQLLFVPALVLMLQIDIPSVFFLAAFLLMLLVYWSTFRSQVPLYLSSKLVWQTLEELLPAVEAGKSFKFMDIGSGMGGVLTHLAHARPDGLYFGVENAPLPYLLSRLKIKFGNYSRCHVMWASLWTCNLESYDVVFAYLSPVPMERLWRKVKVEMRPGSLFISNSFVVAENPAQYSITLDDLHHSTLYIWHM